MIHDVAIAGGGPAGLAAAIRCAERGFRSVVLERAAPPPDKACGEGLMPSGLRELHALGVRPAGMPFHGIRYLQENRAVEARFRGGSGLGIRRTDLWAALHQRALAAGAEVRRAAVLAARAQDDRVEIDTDAGAISARLLVAADGMHSPLRRAAGLDGAPPARSRFGLRRHFSLAPWSDLVEVHWARGVEAYVTPVGPQNVNVAFLWERGEADAGFDDLLGRFPPLRHRLAGAPAASEVRGAGPLEQRVRSRVGPRLALIGDAAGYVDAITGQGLSLAFAAAGLLARALPQDLSADLRPALEQYDASLRRPWLRYALPAHALVALSRRPTLRHAAIHAVATIPGAFAALMRVVV
jgi:flavin-dependent dehydrogenase